MNFIYAAVLAAVAAAPLAAQDGPAPAVRRVASTALLAAQEYAIGVRGGRVVMAAEVDEAKLFLKESRRSAEALPEAERAQVIAALDSVIALVDATGSPDSVSRRVRQLTEGLASRTGVELDELPARAPVLARGAEIYASSCAGCHGRSGAGDGPDARRLDPVPADLTDAEALRDASPLDFYRRITIGVAGTAMPAYETSLTADDRWAVAAYASTLRLPAPAGAVPDSLATFAATARLADQTLLAALGAGPAPTTRDLARLAAVRRAETDAPSAVALAEIFAEVRRQIDAVVVLASAGQREDAETRALDAYMTFEGVERTLRTRDPQLAGELEVAFAELRARAGAQGAGIEGVRDSLGAGLLRAERLIGTPSSPTSLFLQSFILLVREGLEAILIVGALLTFLVKTGASHRRRDIHLGVGAALAASLLTAVLIETLIELSPASQETLEGITMIVATLVLFYVSYWLLSKMEVVKWTRFVKSRVEDAVTSGSMLALASAAFLAVYREGFETILFYKALFSSGGEGAAGPVLGGMAAGTVALVGVYIAINRFGVRLPLKPFFALTSAFLYAMAFIFAGKGVAELQAGRLVSTTYVPGAPNVPVLGIFPTVETLLAQGVLLVLAAAALVWTFIVLPTRLRVTSVMVPESDAPRVPGPRAAPAPVPQSRELVRSLERIEADLAEVRSEVDRMRRTIAEGEEAKAPRSK
ncbi:MAG TPA: FTR1 family protein [Gemmatimonadales bacterium]|nr:FTR1 family protein [Gemmatimonadales bacterium]